MPLKGIFSFPNISNANLTYEQSPETEVTLGSLTVTLWNSKQKSWSTEKIIQGEEIMNSYKIELMEKYFFQ